MKRIQATRKTSPLEWLRRECRALTGMEEKIAWGHPTFHVGGHTIAAFEVFHGRPSIAVWADGDRQEFLVEHFGFFKTPYSGRYGWVSACVDVPAPWALIRSLLAEAQYLAAWSAAVRESTLKRLRCVPEGQEDWRVSPQAMSFADLAHHLLDADAWLFQKLADRFLEPMVGHAGISHITARSQYLDLLTRLQSLGADRERLISGLTADQLAETIFDRRFGGEVTVWWVLVRGTLDHEVHHRGQISAFLRAAGIPPS